MNKPASKWTSRKFWVAIIAAIVTIGTALGFDMTTIQATLLGAMDAILAVWIIIEGIIDKKRLDVDGVIELKKLDEPGRRSR